MINNSFPFSTIVILDTNYSMQSPDNEEQTTIHDKSVGITSYEKNAFANYIQHSDCQHLKNYKINFHEQNDYYWPQSLQFFYDFGEFYLTYELNWGIPNLSLVKFMHSFWNLSSYLHISPQTTCQTWNVFTTQRSAIFLIPRRIMLKI